MKIKAKEEKPKCPPKPIVVVCDVWLCDSKFKSMAQGQRNYQITLAASCSMFNIKNTMLPLYSVVVEKLFFLVFLLQTRVGGQYVFEDVNRRQEV